MLTRVTSFHIESFKDHELKLLHAATSGQVGNTESFRDAKFLVFVMKKKGTSVRKVQITFTPEGIAIQGDVGLGPSNHGVCSGPGYGLRWWVSLLSEGYLAEKFLHRCWTRERALEECEWRRDEAARELAAEEAKEDEERITEQKAMLKTWDIVIRGLDGGDFGESDLYSALDEAGYDCSDGAPGWGYDINDMGWLAAIQQTFKRLWDEQAPKLEQS